MEILIRYLKNYKKAIGYTLFFSVTAQIFVFLDPYIFRIIIDKYILKYKHYSPTEFLHGTGLLVILAVIVALMSRLCKNLQDYFLKVITQKLGAEIYSDGITHSLELPYSNFENQKSGETLAILQTVREDVEKLVLSSISIFFSQMIGLVLVFFYAISIHWSIGLTFVIIIPILIIITSVLSLKIKTVQKKILKGSTTLAGSTTESLRNIEIIKILGLEEQEIKRLNNTTKIILKLQLKKAKYSRTINFIQGSLINLLLNGLLILMFYLIYTDIITAGQFFSLFMYSVYIVRPLQELPNIVNSYRETQVSLIKFDNILKLEKEKKPESPLFLSKINKVRFQNVDFKYSLDGKKILNSISFEANVGETVAFVGPSGSGKTTILKLLVGLYQPSNGEIFFNDAVGNLIDTLSLRKKIGFVPQDTQLFAGTFRENLLFVSPNATDEACFKALTQAACQNLISEKGLDTIIGEGGIKISGGERQRLSIARALIREPDLLIFDEATSALDSITEEEITKTIYKISNVANHITIIISHRLSTVINADNIYVLEKGNIIENGTHNHLIAKNGLYSSMWHQQIGNKEIIKSV